MVRVTKSMPAALLVMAGCLFPTERSDELSIEFPPVGDLYLKDSIQLNAVLVGADGQPLENGQIRYESSDATIVSVDQFGMLLAVGSGTATVTADALLYENTDPTSQQVTVRGLLEIDSIRPLTARFGEQLTLFGVGLHPDSLFAVGIGATFAPDLDHYSTYTPADPEFPNRLGQLAVYVPPPAGLQSTLSVIGFNGVRIHDETLRVNQLDYLEPNDTVARNLGLVSGLGFVNPALAFESQRRDEKLAPVDWYRFSNASVQNRTIVVASEAVGAESFSLFLTDSLRWNGATKSWIIGPLSWTIGPSTYFCLGLQMSLGGEPFQPLEKSFPAAFVSLGDLPIGTYHLGVFFDAPADPQPYSLGVLNGYFSIDNTPKYVAEENGYCNVAKDISVGTGAPSLTIDNPHDIDWFRVSVPAGGRNALLSTMSSDSLLDIDMYLVRNSAPTGMPIVDLSAEFGSSETICARAVDLSCTGPLFLAQGEYFLVIVDYEGHTGTYSLSGTFTSPPAGATMTAPSLHAFFERPSLVRKRATTAGGPVGRDRIKTERHERR